MEDFRQRLKRRYQVAVDRVTPFTGRRWTVLVLLLAFFACRVYMKQGYAVIAYLLGLYYINLLMLYLAPAEDPEEVALKSHDYVLPTKETDEYKGF
jgi:predicted benzoate:H+ symporter BenE